MEKNDDIILEFISLDNNIDIYKLLNEVLKDNHIPIIGYKDLDTRIDKIIHGFTLKDANDLMDIQLEYENYEGATFLVTVMDQIKEELKTKQTDNINEQS